MAERPALWIFGAVALVIALVAFGLGQRFEGAGMVFVLGASTAWAVIAHRLWSNKARG